MALGESCSVSQKKIATSEYDNTILYRLSISELDDDLNWLIDFHSQPLNAELLLT